MKKIKIGIVGVGTVGQGVIEILCKHQKSITSRIDAHLEIAAVCDIKRKKLPKSLMSVYTKRWQDVVKNPEIDLVVELIGGYEPARSIIESSLKSGKNIVTANKAVLAKYWSELFLLARRYKKLIYFEAAVGGAIPVIQTINEGLAANKITKITGILNGTTNFILTKMQKEGVSFREALKAAQNAGFCEVNPMLDIKGVDTANKLAILVSVGTGSWVKVDDILIEGIEKISLRDISYFKDEFDYTLKLIGKAVISANTIDISVRPTLISSSHPFRNVDGEYNAVMIHGDSSEDIMLYGKGAGRGPAASAVVSDIIFLSRKIATDTDGIQPYINFDEKKQLKVLTPDERKGFYYLRFTVVDQPGVLASITSTLAKNNVSIASVFQKESLDERYSSRSGASIVILTHLTNEGDLMRSLRAIDKLKVVKGKSIVYPIEG